MTREQYIKMRQTRQYDMNLFYRYYVKNAKETSRIDFQIFAQLFQMYFQANANSIIEKLDKEFSLYILMDKNGKELKIW